MKKSRDSINQPEAAAFRRVKARSAGARERLLAEEGGTLTPTKFASVLSVPVGELANFCRDRRMFFVLWKGQRRYPAWQLHRSRLLPGLDCVLDALVGRHRYVPLSVVLFFLTPADALEGRRPLDLLRRSQVDDVVKHATLWFPEGL